MWCLSCSRNSLSRNKEEGRGVEIVALMGPSQATRTRVMQELILKPFDVLHYAGHCMYDKQKPSASGWILPASVSVPTS